MVIDAAVLLPQLVDGHQESYPLLDLERSEMSTQAKVMIS